MMIGAIIAVILIIVLIVFLKSKKEKVENDKEQTVEVKPTVKTQESPKPKVVVPKKVFPEAKYKAFDHSRIITDLGLAEEDAKEFIDDLIAQIDSTIPLIQKAVEAKDIKKLEELTHSIKGSATNLGSEGVASLLIDFNTYLKTDEDIEIIQRYFEHLEYYAKELKAQYH